MPELPEVEAARKHLALHCKGKRIVEVITREQGNGPRHGQFDEMMFEQKLPEDVRQRFLTGAFHSQGAPAQKTSLNRAKSEPQVPSTETPPDPAIVEQTYQGLIANTWVQSVQRKGKQMWLELSSDMNAICKEEEQLALLLHFGMTGSIVIKGHKIPSYRYRSFYVGEEEAWPPKFTKLELVFSETEEAKEEDLIRVALCDPRRLGYVKLRINPRNTPPISALAPDPVTDPIPSIAEIKDQLAKCSTNIKTLLLNQEKLFCGIGNYLADEILYQSKIHPQTIASEINEEGLTTIVTKMKEIIAHAMSVDADYEYFPKDWLFHYRWDKGKGESPKLPNGNAVSYETVNGRTTAFVAKEQLKDGYYKIEATEVKKKHKVTTSTGSVTMEEDVQTVKRSRKRKGEEEVDATEVVTKVESQVTKKTRRKTSTTNGDEDVGDNDKTRKRSKKVKGEEVVTPIASNKGRKASKNRTKAATTEQISSVTEVKLQEEVTSAPARRSRRLTEKTK